MVGSVEVVEALGADTLIHVAVAGRTIIARLPQGIAVRVGGADRARCRAATRSTCSTPRPARDSAA